jgi:hypothetical protein
MVSVSGAPLCSISSTVNVPFLSARNPASLTTASTLPRGGSYLAVSVIELDIELVGLESAIVGHGQTDKAVTKSCVISSLSSLSINAGQSSPRPEYPFP